MGPFLGFEQGFGYVNVLCTKKDIIAIPLWFTTSSKHGGNRFLSSLIIYEDIQKNLKFNECLEIRWNTLYFSIYPQNGKPYSEWNMCCALFEKAIQTTWWRKMAMWNFAHSRFIKLWKSNTNTTEKFIKHVLPAKVRAINRLKNTNQRTKKRQEWGGGGLRKNVCVSTRSRTRHPLYDDQ